MSFVGLLGCRGASLGTAVNLHILGRVKGVENAPRQMNLFGGGLLLLLLCNAVNATITNRARRRTMRPSRQRSPLFCKTQSRADKGWHDQHSAFVAN